MFDNIRHIIHQLLRIKWFTIILPMIILGVFIFLVTINNVHTETYDIERFAQAKETIRSPITMENEQETKRKIRETIQAVEDRYSIDDEVEEEQVEYIEEIFDALVKVEEEAKDVKEDAKEDDPLNLATDRGKLLRLDELLSEEITTHINDSYLIGLLELSKKDREEAYEVFIDAITEVFEEGIRTSTIQRAKTDVEQYINYSELEDDVKDRLLPLIDFAVVENSFFDPEKTSQAQKEAANSVDPVVIRAGEIIVREGQTITNEIYEELKLLGLLHKERNWYPLIGLSILIFFVLCVIVYEMYALHQSNQLNNKKISSIVLISLIVISLMKIASLYYSQESYLYYAVPVATGVLLIKLLINERLAIVLASLYAILGSLIFNAEIPGSLNFEAGVYFFFSQLAAIIFLANIKDRFSIVRAGIGMAVINALTVLLFSLLSFEKYYIADLLIQSGLGILAAFLSAVLTIGLLPFFETALGILSDVRLLSLASPNHPLLRKLLIEAPGTYHHSIMVANLSETACEAIGARGLLARVGAYFHDIGKTVQPHYFIENQLSIKNPHDELHPRKSAEIIINHPYEGAKMLKKHKLPKEIIDITKQHHGTSLLKFFYHKEKDQNNLVREDLYRYPGPKPQTKEAAVICICDAVEAAVRSLKEPTEEQIDEIVTNIVTDRVMDGQLDECPLTLKEIHTIHQTICETLKGIFHSRIQYPMEDAK